MYGEPEYSWKQIISTFSFIFAGFILLFLLLQLTSIFTEWYIDWYDVRQIIALCVWFIILGSPGLYLCKKELLNR